MQRTLFQYKITFAQEYLIDLTVGFLMFKNDSVHFQKPKTVTFSTSGCTEIFSLNKSCRYEFGMRLEILPSKLTGKDKYLVGKIYYVKHHRIWQEVMKIEHQEQEIRLIAQREKTDMFVTGDASTDFPDTFDVRLNDNYYVLK